MDAFPMTLDDVFRRPGSGLGRRDFIKTATLAAAAVGLTSSAAAQVAEQVAKGRKPSVVWLHFQECTGCTESLLRTGAPRPRRADPRPHLARLPRDPARRRRPPGREVRSHDAMEANAGQVHLHRSRARSRPRTNGIYCKIGGRTALEMRRGRRRARPARSSPSARAPPGAGSRRPIRTRPAPPGRPTILEGKTVVTLPGCPANPYNLLGTALQYATLRHAARARREGPSAPAYARTIHEDCPRRAHFDAGRFAQQFGDEGHRLGLLPVQARLQGSGRPTPTARSCTSARPTPGRSASATRASAAPSRSSPSACRCTTTVDIDRPTPPDTYPPIHAEHGRRQRGRDRRRRPRRRAPSLGARLHGRQEARRRRRRPAGDPRRRRSHHEARAGETPSRSWPPRAHRPPRGAAPPPAARARRSRPPGALGMLYDTTRCIGCKTCVVAVQAGQRSPRRHHADRDGRASTTPRPISTATPRTSSSSTRTGDSQSYMKAQCMHCVDPACTARMHAGLAAQGRSHRHRLLRPDVLRRLPLLP